jgi:hypothetical protein
MLNRDLDPLGETTIRWICYACTEPATGMCASCDRRYCDEHGGAVSTLPPWSESSCPEDYGESFCETCRTGEEPDRG